MGFKMKYEVKPRYLTSGSKRRSGLKAGTIKFIVAHDTGNPGSTANNNVTYYERSRDEMSASAHLFVDHNEILECIPALTGTPEKAWHVMESKPKDNELFGCDANNNAIGVELCYGGGVDTKVSYAKYVWTMAYLCHKFNINPLTNIVGHYTLDPERRSDPMTAFKTLGKTFEQFLKDVKAELDECTKEESVKEGVEVLELTAFQWTTLENNVKNLLDEKIISDANWLTKVKQKKLTVSELTWLNSTVLDRLLNKTR